MTSTAAKLATETAIVTKAELVELREWEADFAKYKKKASEAEKQVDVLRLALAQKVLGVESEDELKLLSLEKVQKLYAKRHADGRWELGKGAPVFAFDQVSKGRYPAWKKLFSAKLGALAALQAVTETPETYSYRVEVAQPL